MLVSTLNNIMMAPARGLLPIFEEDFAAQEAVLLERLRKAKEREEEEG